MQIPNINRYLLNIYEESVLKYLKSLGVCSLGVGFWFFNISRSVS